MKKIFLFVSLIASLSACNKNQQVEEQTVVKMGTIENPQQAVNFYLNQDDSVRVWVLNSELKYYRPADKKRVIMEYVILNTKPAGSTYQYDVKLNDVYEILTKSIFNITAATQDSIGNDPVSIRNMWISGDYLNIEFLYPGYSKTHYINLVSDTSKTATYTDGKIHLEFRHNANNDYPSFSISGIVSFDISSLKVAGSKSTDFVVHTNEFDNTNANKSYVFTYNYDAPTSVKQMKIPLRKAIFK